MAYKTEHRVHGVDLRVNQQVEALESDSRVSGVRLGDCELLSAKMAIIAGAQTGNGEMVNAQGRTSLPDAFAIGDCAAHANRFAGSATIRLEPIQNYNEMASVVAKTICGEDVSYTATPWFWSNQYDLKLQTVGLSSGHASTVLRCDPAARKFSVVYLDSANRVIALDCVNNARDHSYGHRLVELGVTADPGELTVAERQFKDRVPQSPKPS